MNLEQEEPGSFAEEDLLLAHIVASQVGAAIHRCQLVEEVEGAFLSTLGVLADAAELQDSYTADHANEVAELAIGVGRRLGFGGAELDRLRYGALLHDVGKIGVPGELLRKPGPLSAEERERMDEHTAIGARMLDRIPFLAPVAPLVRSAHERFDGGGYPDGLRGDEIPRAAMVIATCDAFHAMTSDRSYRQAMDRAEAIRELQANAGTQFDPVVVDALVAERADRRGPTTAVTGRPGGTGTTQLPPRLPSIACSAIRIRPRPLCGRMSLLRTRTWEPCGPMTSTIVQTSPISQSSP